MTPTSFAVQFKPYIGFSTLRRCNPFSLLPRRIVPEMPWMTTWQICYTVLIFVLMETSDFFFIPVLIFFVTHISMPFVSTGLKGFKTYFWDHKQTNRNYSPSHFCILIDNHDFSFKFITIGHAYVYTISFLDFLQLVSTIWSHEVLPTICCSTSQTAVLFLVFANSVILLRYNYRHALLSIKK